MVFERNGFPKRTDVCCFGVVRAKGRPRRTDVCCYGAPGSAHWIRDRLYEAGLEHAVLPSALDGLYAAVRGPAADLAPPLTGAGLWCADASSEARLALTSALVCTRGAESRNAVVTHPYPAANQAARCMPWSCVWLPCHCASSLQVQGRRDVEDECA